MECIYFEIPLILIWPLLMLKLDSNILKTSKGCCTLRLFSYWRVTEWSARCTLNSVILGLRSSDHYLDLFHCSPKFKSSPMLVNSQLICLWPVGILNKVLFNLNYLFSCLLGPTSLCAINSAKSKLRFFELPLVYFHIEFHSFTIKNQRKTNCNLKLFSSAVHN